MPVTVTQPSSLPQAPMAGQTKRPAPGQLQRAIGRMDSTLSSITDEMNRQEVRGFTSESETVRKGEVQTIRNVCQWIRRPTATGNGFERGVLCINAINYNVRCTFDITPEGSVFQIVDLTKSDGKHTRVILGAVESCDCEAATYRAEVTCKHIRSVRAALDWLETHQRLEWEAGMARRDLAEHSSEAPF